MSIPQLEYNEMDAGRPQLCIFNELEEFRKMSIPWAGGAPLLYFYEISCSPWPALTLEQMREEVHQQRRKPPTSRLTGLPRTTAGKV